tara:strand:- start:125 stop:709 length:585 start_codon:yes stop_codon:yes gene_type:complete
MNNLKEFKFKKDSFIGGWFISEKVCDDLITFKNDNINSFDKGKLYNQNNEINLKDKDSLDLGIKPNTTNFIFVNYELELQKVLNRYIEKYPQVNSLNRFSIIENYNIQHYYKNCGYRKWHCERGSLRNGSRALVFMTYLNDVGKSGTEFLYQNIKVPAKKGLTLIWPTDWTHTHRGIISKNKEKTIVTGWFNFQ